MTELEELKARIEHLEKMPHRLVKNVTFTQQGIQKLTKVVDCIAELCYPILDTDTKKDENEQTH